MGFFRRKAAHGPLDVVQLQLDNDVAGLVRALTDASAPVVEQAADALATIHRRESEPIRGQAAATAGALLQALATMQARADVPVEITSLLDAGDAESATWAIIRTLGEIDDPAALPVLCDIAATSAVKPERRRFAIEALGRMRAEAALGVLLGVLREPTIDRPVILSSDAAELSRAAATALARLGSAGVAALCEEVSAGGADTEAAVAALRTVGAGDLGHDRAAETVAAVDAVAEQTRIGEHAAREAAEEAERSRRREEYPVAAALADRLGHPEWLSEAGALVPYSYADAVDACRTLGLPVADREDVIDDETSDVWAIVTTLDGPVLINGGRRFRDVLY